MEKAIQKAISGGYVTGFMYDRLAKIDPLGAAEILFLDPKWWQSLVRADQESGDSEQFVKDVALARWHRFIDHLAEGKDINSFFEELLK